MGEIVIEKEMLLKRKQDGNLNAPSAYGNADTEPTLNYAQDQVGYMEGFLVSHRFWPHTLVTASGTSLW